MNYSELQSHLPLTESTFFVLLSLAPKAKHGYAIMKDVEALSQTQVTLSTGTLYGALKRLLESGWIERFEDIPQTGVGTRERKTYRLTPLGRRILQAETKRMEALVAVALPRLAGGEA